MKDKHDTETIYMFEDEELLNKSSENFEDILDKVLEKNSTAFKILSE